MIDAILWTTGLVTWVLLLLYVGPMMPAALTVVCFWVTSTVYFAAKDRLFDDSDAVRLAWEVQSRRWRLLVAIGRLRQFCWSTFALYLDVIEPIYTLLPFVTRGEPNE